MAKAETFESFQELAAEQFETIEDEYNYHLARLHHLEGDLALVKTARDRGGIIYELKQVRSQLGRLKPHLKNERTSLKGKPVNFRGRVDVMEDMLIELREIKTILHERLPRD